MRDEVDEQLKLVELVSNQGVSYNNDLLDEYFDTFIEPITVESIASRSDEELLEVIRENWVTAFIYAIYSFEGKKVVIDKGWKINLDMFEYFRPQFDEAYRKASLGFGQMNGSAMKIVFDSRPHLRERLDEFVDNEKLISKMKEEAKVRAAKFPHKGYESLQGRVNQIK